MCAECWAAVPPAVKRRAQQAWRTYKLGLVTLGDPRADYEAARDEAIAAATAARAQDTLL